MTNKEETTTGFPDRIPYEQWANSQLSIAKYYGGCMLGNDHYVLDYDNAPKKIIDGKEKYFPDLVKANLLNKQDEK